MKRAVLALIMVSVLSVPACHSNVGPVIGQTVIDCVSADRAKIDALLGEFKPLLTTDAMSWPDVYQRAKEAGTAVGGCFLAELVQSYLGGKMAPATGDGWTARQTLEDFRAKEAGNATFRTANGDL